MAEIDIQKKRHSSTWPIWLLGLLLVGLLVWWVWPDDDSQVAIDEDYETEPATVPPPAPVGGATGIAVTEIVASPTDWDGRSVSGEVRVVEVTSDEGFWIEEQGQRLFVVVSPSDDAPTLQPNTMVTLTGATVRGADYIAQLTNLEDQTMTLLRGQRVFLVVAPSNIQTSGTSGTTGSGQPNGTG